MLGEKEESMVSFGPDTSCSCTVISGPMVSSVKVKLDSVCGFQAAVHFGGPFAELAKSSLVSDFVFKSSFIKEKP